ncbi:hypothetical protein ANCDUO_09771 [Ancylostoma duodenale]|uniref:Uncharacterized protein n=1 Tax=Ancylostoma duodenale TaxID=51022 RepID=A0A0C2GSF3_9BILA|nr:hypothetical protein ANCDUO_09771 [Ancylostoma duodenale]
MAYPILKLLLFRITIEHSAESSTLTVDDDACIIHKPRKLAQHPVQKFINTFRKPIDYRFRRINACSAQSTNAPFPIFSAACVACELAVRWSTFEIQNMDIDQMIPVGDVIMSNR